MRKITKRLKRVSFPTLMPNRQWSGNWYSDCLVVRIARIINVASNEAVGTMLSDLFLFHLLRTLGSCHDAGVALVLEPVALAGNLNDGRVMQDPVEHGGGEHSVAGERLVPTAECEIGGEDQTSFVTPRNHLEKQIGLLASEQEKALVEARLRASRPRLWDGRHQRTY